MLVVRMYVIKAGIEAAQTIAAKIVANHSYESFLDTQNTGCAGQKPGECGGWSVLSASWRLKVGHFRIAPRTHHPKSHATRSLTPLCFFSLKSSLSVRGVAVSNERLILARVPILKKKRVGWFQKAQDGPLILLHKAPVMQAFLAMAVRGSHATLLSQTPGRHNHDNNNSAQLLESFSTFSLCCVLLVKY